MNYTDFLDYTGLTIGGTTTTVLGPAGCRLFWSVLVASIPRPN